MIRVMNIADPLRRLDDRVLPVQQGERARVARHLPWLAFGTLLLQIAAVMTGIFVFQGMALVLLTGVAVGTLQMSVWLRQS